MSYASVDNPMDLRAYTPANASVSIDSSSRRPGTKAFAERLAREASLTDPEAIAEAETRRTMEADAYEKAKEFVAQSLVQPLLKQLRESNNAWGPFKPGQHEKSFSWLIDEQISNRIVDSKNFPVVDRVAETLMNVDARRRDAAARIMAARESNGGDA